MPTPDLDAVFHRPFTIVGRFAGRHRRMGRMEWALAVIALALLLGLGVLPVLRRPGPELSADERELHEVFASVEAEVSSDLVTMLRLRVLDLIDRQVPVRDIRAAPTRRVARIAFSNGVVVLARTRTPGDLVPLARAMMVTSVTLASIAVTDNGPVLRFKWNYGHSLEMRAVGLDQAD